MKSDKIQPEQINEFELKLARNVKVVAVVNDIVKLSPKERVQEFEDIRHKIQQGAANLFEERVYIKLLEPGNAERIQAVAAHLSAADKEPPKQVAAPAIAPVPVPPPSDREYPSELLDFLASQKPPSPPQKNSAARSNSNISSADTESPHPLFVLRDIVLAVVCLAFLIMGLWFARSSDQADPDIILDNAATPGNPLNAGIPAERQPQIQAEFDAAAQALRFGNFDQGNAQLTELIKTYPNSAYAQNAHILIADTYRQRQNNPDAALKYYQMFLEKYPQSQQAGVTQLKMGFTYEDLNDAINADAMYRLVIKQEGERSRLGQLAQERLAALKNPSATP